MRDSDDQTAPLRGARHARLFALYRQERLPGDESPVPVHRETVLSPEEARRLQEVAIASLSRGTPWRQRIFRLNRTGSPAA
ncbi:hypothetical protein SAMN05216376_101588 [Mameliella alba]|nr:hypothetical protein LX94_00586 [Mameliella alba]GGF72796.1 hypothetical protein GCM10011319_36660 [Mameliella alba]SDC19726.1 hypothetical protein SAMN05216376_101588 [Mameliella alba]